MTKPQILATMGATLYASGAVQPSDPEAALKIAAELLSAAEAAEQAQSPGRLSMSLHGVSSAVHCKAEVCASRAESQAYGYPPTYDVIRVGHDLTLFFSRAQTVHLRDVLSALIDSEDLPREHEQ